MGDYVFGLLEEGLPEGDARACLLHDPSRDRWRCRSTRGSLPQERGSVRTALLPRTLRQKGHSDSRGRNSPFLDVIQGLESGGPETVCAGPFEYSSPGPLRRSTAPSANSAAMTSRRSQVLHGERLPCLDRLKGLKQSWRDKGTILLKTKCSDRERRSLMISSSDASMMKLFELEQNPR